MSFFMAPRTLYEKIWDAHVVHEEPGQPSLIYIDRHLIHEGTTPAGILGLESRGPQSAPPGADFRGDGPFGLDQRPAAAGARCRRQGAIRCAGAQLPGERHQSFRHAQPQSGHRARDRPGAGHHAARNAPSSAATATPPRTARSARWPSASGRAKWSTCWRRSASRSSNRRP